MSMGRTERSVRQLWVSLLLALTMAMCLVVAFGAMKAWAVTGSEVAEDGEYTSTITAYKYKDGARTTTYYTATLDVTVKDGKISNMALSDGKKYKNGAYKEDSDEILTNLLPSISGSYVGKDARVSAVEDVDAVSSASVADVDTTSSATKTEDHEKYYVADVNAAVIAALKTAPVASSSSGSQTGSTAKTVQGTASVSDSERSKIVVNVGLDSDGKITSIAADSSSVGDWSSILSKNESSYIGQTSVDTVSGATKYSTALNTAVRAALGSKGSSSDSGNSSGDSPADSSSTTITVKSGETQTFTGETFGSDKKIIVEAGATAIFKGCDIYYNCIQYQPSSVVAMAATSGGKNTVLRFSDDAGLYIGNVLGTATAGKAFTQSFNLPANVSSTTGSGASYVSAYLKPGYSAQVGKLSVNSDTRFVAYAGLPQAAGLYPVGTILATYGDITYTVPFVLQVVENKDGSKDTQEPDLPTDISSSNQIRITKTWSDGNDKHTGESVIAGVYDGDNIVSTVTLSASNNWTATVSAAENKTYTVKEDRVLSGDKDVTAQYESTVEAGTATTEESGSWTKASGLTAGPTYVITYTSGGQTYLLTASGSSVVGTPVTLENGMPGDVADSNKWDVESSYGSTRLSIHGQDNYMKFGYSGVSMGSYSPYANHEVTYTGGALKGAGSYPWYLSASGSSVSGSSSSGTQMTLWTGGKTTVTTTPYTITNTPRHMFKLTYEANAGEDTVENLPGEQTADADGKVTVSETTPAREGYTFLGWSTGSNATEADAAYSANTEVTLTADTTLYAVWQINTHTVTFDVQGHGTAPETQTVNYNGTATRPETDPTADGYTFGGWYTEAECTNEYDFTTPVTSETTVYAKWTPAEYTITYDLDGGSLAEGVTNPGTYTIESDDITLSNPTREGYTFTGWTGTDLTEASQNVTIAKGSTGNRTYTAAWEAAETTYTVRHYLQNLDSEDYTEQTADVEIKTGKAGETTAAAAKVYAGFTAKDFEQTQVSADGSTVISIYYDRNSHNVTYSVTGEAPAGSSTPDSVTYKYGASVSAASPLTSSETTKGDLQGTWTFSGWTTSDAAVADNAFTMPDKDVAFTGTWTFTEAGKYNVSYVVNGDKPSDYQEPNGPKNQYAGTVLNMPSNLTTNDTAKDGVPGTWSFSGWTITAPADLTADGSGQYTMPSSDVTITGSWTFTPGTYTVTWKNEDGTVLETDTGVAYNAEPEYNGGTPTKAEDETNTYTFAGWTPETSPVTGNVTYTAVFSPVPKTVYYTVTFDSDGGSAVDSQTVAAGSTATEPAAPTKDGFTFKGWTLNGRAYDFSTPVTGDITLKASWEQNQPETPAPTPDPGYTIDTTQKSHTYEIYQIFTGNYTEKDGKAILTDLVWGENGKSSDEANPASVGQPVPEEIINALKALTGGEVEPSDKKKLAEIEKYVNMTQAGNYPKVITSQNGDQAKITDLPAGYYLIKDKDGSQTGKDDSYTLYITQIVKDYTIKPKSVKPTVDKQVSDDDESDTTSSENATNKNPGSSWYETADHAIGETFQFRLIATLPTSTHYADYSAYKLVFTDTMSAGVTFDGIASVSVDSTAVPESGYIVSGVNAGEAGKTWTLTISNVKSVQSDLSNGAVVTVVYNAHLNENAIVHKTGADQTTTNANTVSLQYSNNPNTGHGEEMGKTASDTVWVFTYEVDNTKKKNSEDGDALPGAGFRLYDSNGSEIALTYNGTKGAYLPAAAGAAGAEMKSGQDGKFNIIGLDAGTYTLKETKTPDGYNKCADTTVTISASHSENNDTTTAKLDLGSSKTDNTIINNSGTALPSTGGIGTRIFYILGTILVLGAGVVLVSRRRSRDN